MIDAITNTVQLASASSTTSLSVPSAANFSDVERFRAAMMSPQTPPAPSTVETGGVQATGMPASAEPIMKLPPVGSGPTIGDTILSAVSDLSADTRQRFAQVGEVLGKPNLSMSDVMSLQFTLLQTSVQFEIASKGITKLTQNVESIIKTQ